MKSNLLFDHDHRQQVMIPELEQQKFKALKEHVVNMIGLFVMGCGAPAFIRVLGQLIDGSKSSVTSRPTSSAATSNDQDSSTGTSRWANYMSAFYFILAIVLLNCFYISYVRRVVGRLTLNPYEPPSPIQNVPKGNNNQQSIQPTYRSIS